MTIKKASKSVHGKSPEHLPKSGNPASSVHPIDTSVPIVGIGASAGGLAAFEAFFSAIPPESDPGMAFVLVQHLAPDHRSILAELIQRYTRMQVFEVEDGMAVRPNCTYIIPPNRDMAYLNGSLQLLEPSQPHGQRLPIDIFFRSLAQDQHERAIGIVLSGTGSDGTLGVRAIKGEAGMVMAQTPASAEFDGMPRNAIATGLVDFELPPAEMPAQLIAYVDQAFGKLPPLTSAPAAGTENALQKIYVLLRAQTSHDFSQYKPSTIRRRIERRMTVHQIETIDSYVRFLQQTPAEVESLFRDLLIWAHVAATVVRDHAGDTTLRVVLSDVSRLKKAESALKESETFNRAILDSLNEEIAVLDRDGTIIAVNQAWRRFAQENKKPSGRVEPPVRVGVNYLTVCGAASADDRVGATDAGLARDGIRSVLEGHSPDFSLEYSCHSEKQKRWFSMNVTPLGDGAVVSHANITQVKQLEEAANASLLYLRSLIEAILDPLVTIGADGKITDANSASEAITGVSRDALIGTDHADYFTDPANVRVAYQQVIAQGTLSDYPLAIRHVSGKVTDVLGNASLYRDPSGKVLGVFATAHDVTERKRVLEKLHEQKAFFHLIAESISDLIAVLDVDGRRIYNSPSYQQLFGSNRELHGTDAFAEIHPDDRERMKKIFREVVQTGHNHQLEYRLVVADGGVRTMESRSSVIRNHKGKVARVIVVSHDITERKQLEYQIHQMAFHDTLTRLPNRRMLNDRLSQAMAASARSGYYGAVMFLDLDNFKPLNDKHGHDVGDLLLIEVAERLKRCVREMDTVARFGGDEFIVMISELATGKAESVAEAGIIAEKIRLRLAEPCHLTVQRMGMPEGTVEYRCTASIGVAVFINHEASPDHILKCADAAMYQAKESGRNSVRFVEMGCE